MNNNKIAVTTTSTLRPDLLDSTYSSFFNNVKNISKSNCTLYINIDNAPKNSKYNYNDILDVCYKHFDYVIYNYNEIGNFPNALKWCWSNAKGEYVINLEDDWIFNDVIDLDLVKNIINSDKNVIGVSFNAYYFNYRQNRIRLSPCLLKIEWCNHVADLLTSELCPEQQLQKMKYNENNIMLNYPPYTSRYDCKIMVTDTGRNWRNIRNIARPNNETFTHWIVQEKKIYKDEMR